MTPTEPPLSPEERQVLKDLESGALRRLPRMAQEKKALETAARETLQKDRRHETFPD